SPGKPANFFILTSEGEEIPLRSKASSPPRLEKGWELWMETAGGGGYGDADNLQEGGNPDQTTRSLDETDRSSGSEEVPR
ncbi:MAG TPA: hypothetical protein VE225_05985, partial [Rubrobacteraceae bacterium]|nr:hypothetical protein [Rubrobacteraceae bacterium]